MSRRNNCMFLFPHELTGLGECCGLFGGQLVCNGYGKKCCGYQPHDQHTRKALAEAISRAHRAGEHNNKPNNEGSNNE